MWTEFEVRTEAPDGGGIGEGEGGAQPTQNAPQIDYERIAEIVAGKQRVAEDTVLKGYFTQQGLTGDEMKQAINAFKQQKAESMPDVSALQAQMAQATAAAQEAQLQSVATMSAVELGLDAKAIPYILRMADLKSAIGTDGKINAETVKNALNKVLEDVPALKPQNTGSTGFIKVGAGGSQGETSAALNDDLKKAFGL